MSSGKVKWITINDFAVEMDTYGITTSNIEKWIKNREITIKNTDDIYVAKDYKYNTIIYRLSVGRNNNIVSTNYLGKPFKIINKNTIRIYNGSYIVYTLDGKVRTFRKAERAIEWARGYDSFISYSSNSKTVMLNEVDIKKLKSILNLVGYQGKINNKFNRTLKRIKDGTRDNSYNNKSNRDNSDNDNSIIHAVPREHERSPKQERVSVCSSSVNSVNGSDMEQVGRKTRAVKISKHTRKYIMEKYNLSQSKMTYILNYTKNDNSEAIKIIAEAIEHDKEYIRKLNEVIDGIKDDIS